MRQIDVSEIVKSVSELCMEANFDLNTDIEEALYVAQQQEDNDRAKSVLANLLKNAEIAKMERLAMCQDTGMAVVFLELGQEIYLTGGNLEDAIHKGVRLGYQQGYLRKSVAHPITRVNTGDNTPAIIHLRIVPGQQLKITVAPKGFGSENMGSLTLLVPGDGLDGIKKAVIDTVKRAGSNPCPPIIVGVGIGGTMEYCTYLAKRALLRKVGGFHKEEDIASLEKELLLKINQLRIGPQGFGGRTTALHVAIEYAPTHIAGLPVAVNIGCHATRHKTRTL
jgi:fumarate hydratase subunit alpha